GAARAGQDGETPGEKFWLIWLGWALGFSIVDFRLYIDFGSLRDGVFADSSTPALWAFGRNDPDKSPARRDKL
ncbi:MAG: hypothetical protein J7M40_05185, partial [Planctomycetes bacterium]|nr:hypothetical protein [Planctomycetota bacterium]